MSNKQMTIKQLAELVGVSKQAINNRINKLPDDEKPKMINNTYVIEEPLISEFIEIYNNDAQIGGSFGNRDNGTTNRNKENDEPMVDIEFMESVIKELQTDKQELYKQIDKLQQLLQNQQILSLKANERVLALESELKESKVDEDETNKNEVGESEINDIPAQNNEPVKMGWFAKLKSKFNK